MYEMIRTIFVGGISGVGKTTLLEELARTHSNLVVVSAGDLIRTTIGAQGRVVVSDRDTAEFYQTILINAYSRIAVRNRDIVALDGHYALPTPSGVAKISSSVFAALGPRYLMLVVDTPSAIADRRRASNRGESDESAIANELGAEETNAEHVAASLGLDLYTTTPLTFAAAMNDLLRTFDDQRDNA